MGSNSNDVWVVGAFTSSGLTSPIAHYDGNSWTYKRPNNINSINGIRAGNLFGIKGIDKNNIWVVGNGYNQFYPQGDSTWGFVGYYDGAKWENISPNIPNERLFSVWAANNNEVWAVGTNGTILFYNGNNWTKQESGTTLQLCAIDGLNDKNIYAVGYSYDYNEGVILHFDGYNWSKVYLNNGAEFSAMRDIRVFSERKIWVVGLISYEFDGERWNIQGINGNNLLSVDGDGYNDIFMGGFQRTISHFNGLNLNKLFVGSMGLENASIYDIKVFRDKIYLAGRGGIGFDQRGLVYTATK